MLDPSLMTSGPIAAGRYGPGANAGAVVTLRQAFRHHGFLGTPAHGFGIDFSCLVGSGCMTVFVLRGYWPLGHGDGCPPSSTCELHRTSVRNCGLLPPLCAGVPLHGGMGRLEAGQVALERAATDRRVREEAVGRMAVLERVLRDVAVARVPEGPVATELVVVDRRPPLLEQARRDRLFSVPPVHGGPLSVNGTRMMPHAPLLTKRLFITVSLRPPEIDMPVPTGPAAADPAAGTFGLLLSCT